MAQLTSASALILPGRCAVSRTRRLLSRSSYRSDYSEAAFRPLPRQRGRARHDGGAMAGLCDAQSGVAASRRSAYPLFAKHRWAGRPEQQTQRGPGQQSLARLAGVSSEGARLGMWGGGLDQAWTAGILDGRGGL